jgi:ATP-dependent DNA helicase RecG
VAISVIDVGKQDITKTLALEESHFIDVKSVRVSPGKLTKALSAFANADGGELFIGVEENQERTEKTWRGFTRQEEANGHIQAIEEVFPLGDGISYEFLRHPNTRKGLVLHVTVQKAREVKFASDGTPYVRRNAANQPVATHDALELLRRNKGLTSFETETVSVTHEVISNSEIIIEFMLAVVPIAEPHPWLRKQLMIVDGKPTVGAVLLFADEPQAVLPKRSAIKVYRYRTTAEQGTRETLEFDPITIEGCLYGQIRDAVQKTRDLIQGVKVVGERGLETISYPPETLHEIITNAVLHRDYSVLDDIHIRIFDNRVEVESPGRLPGHITEANILQERFSRNGAIVRMINKFPDPPNKDVGEGLNTAFAAMKQLRFREPVIRETDHSVLVEIRHQRLGRPEELIMEHLNEHGEITNLVAREITGIASESSVKTIFYRLQRAGQIERVPDKRGNKAAWRKAAQKSSGNS